ncbi:MULTISPECIES: type III-B CRISPR module RAMP protein Cmr1 [Pseudothermotoga]|uniref:type III-B CRISPR module RAMP protein Cmr1 n=1 Tax=Pseudothermotoga TaxID=1643951 RepID=UPI001E346DD0|nr:MULTISPECIES: type III-B CRISPR module RAMP protein Cmr1 [Pseudothermotoga]
MQAKTPIWTGNIDSKSDTIQPTGIMGSLRWWTEDLLRGMNDFACDPTGKTICPGDE